MMRAKAIDLGIAERERILTTILIATPVEILRHG